MSSNSREGLTTIVFRPPRRTGSAAMDSPEAGNVTVGIPPHFLRVAAGTSTILVVMTCPAQMSSRKSSNVRSHSRVCTALSSASMSVNVRARATLMPPKSSGSQAWVSSASAASSGGRAASDSRMGAVRSLFEALEGVHALLQALGDRQVPGQDDVADVRLRRGLADEQQVIQRVVDEIEIPLDVVPVDVDAAGGAEEALELGKASPSRASPLPPRWGVFVRKQAGSPSRPRLRPWRLVWPSRRARRRRRRCRAGWSPAASARLRPHLARCG